MKTLETGTYVALGAFDLAAEKVRAIPGLKNLREVSLLEQVRDIEPTLRRSAEALSDRGEQVADRLRGQVDEARRTIGGLRVDARDQLGQLRTKVSGRIGGMRGRTDRTTPAAPKKTKAA